MATKARRLQYENIFWISVIHIGALAAIPMFSWQAFGVCIFLLYFISSLGINLTYHRLLTHRGLKVPQWFEYVLSTIAAMSGQGPMLLWVAEHRLHHRYSDTEQDPHSPIKGYFHAHMGHLFYHKEFEDEPDRWQKYVPDLKDKAYYRFLSKYAAIFVALPAIPLYYFGGLPFVMWGIFVRIVLMWHITWSVNSACHTFGYRTFETNDTSTNFWFIGWFGGGEGWHNNHHAHPVSASHGREWYEFDMTYQVIKFLKLIGLATNVKTPVLDSKIKSKPFTTDTWLEHNKV
jgi:stearoyl-CoA desaturase (delta-9 desaturase)